MKTAKFCRMSTCKAHMGKPVWPKNGAGRHILTAGGNVIYTAPCIIIGFYVGLTGVELLGCPHITLLTSTDLS
jgi:hypothetical protein